VLDTGTADRLVLAVSGDSRHHHHHRMTLVGRPGGTS
jgi:hypothetical protein